MRFTAYSFIAIVFFFVLNIKNVLAAFPCDGYNYCYDGNNRPGSCDGHVIGFNTVCNAGGGLGCNISVGVRASGNANLRLRSDTPGVLAPTPISVSGPADSVRTFANVNCGSLTTCSFTPIIDNYGYGYGTTLTCNWWQNIGVQNIAANTVSVTGAAISPTTVFVGDASNYNLSVTANNSAGLSGLTNQAVIINYPNDGNGTSGNYRGLLIWSADNFVTWGSSNIDQKYPCGTGTVGRYNPSTGQTYGAQHINLIGCSATTNGNSRTVNFTVNFNSGFTTPTGTNKNVVSGWAKISNGWVAEWVAFSYFTLGVTPTIIGTSKADAGVPSYKFVALGDVPGDRYRSVINANWKAKTDATGLGTKYGYGYWNTMLWNKATDLQPANVIFDAPGELNSLAVPNTTKIYRYTGNVTISGDQEITTAGGVIILLVNGNLNIDKRILRLNKSTFLAFIVSGNINIASTVAGVGGTPGVDGVFIAGGDINSNIIINGNGLGTDSQLVANGIFFTKGNVTNSRSLSNNSASPAVIYQFDPSLVLNAPIELMKPKFSWKEIAP